MRTAWALVYLPLLAQDPPRPAVDLDTLLRDLGDRGSLARFPAPAYVSRRSASGDPNRTEGVLLDVSGPGAIVRLDSTGQAERLRIHLDGADEPLFEGRLADLLTGRSGPASPASSANAGGEIGCLPIPFERGCRITCDEPADLRFRIEYRLYEEGTRVTSCRRADLERAGKAGERLARAWEGSKGKPTFDFSLSEENPDGGLVCLDPALARGSRAVSELHLRVESTDLLTALRSARIHLEFDGEETVACPLGDFFVARGPTALRTGPIRVARGIDEPVGRPGQQIDLVGSWVMPYRESFDLRIAGGPKDLHVAGLVQTEAWSWDERSMHFHASNEDALAGRGVLVGRALSVGGRLDPLWTEAAEKVFVDGALRSSASLAEAYALPLRSTGGDFESPIHAKLTDSGFVLLCRFHIPDPLPFRKGLRIETEWPTRATETEIERTSTVFYYAFPATRDGAAAGK